MAFRTAKEDQSHGTHRVLALGALLLLGMHAGAQERLNQLPRMRPSSASSFAISMPAVAYPPSCYTDVARARLDADDPALAPEFRVIAPNRSARQSSSRSRPTTAACLQVSLPASCRRSAFPRRRSWVNPWVRSGALLAVIRNWSIAWCWSTAEAFAQGLRHRTRRRRTGMPADRERRDACRRAANIWKSPTTTTASSPTSWWSAISTSDCARRIDREHAGGRRQSLGGLTKRRARDQGPHHSCLGRER